MPREINVFKDANAAEAKRRDHESAGRTAKVKEHNGLVIYDHRESEVEDPKRLLRETGTVYVVYADW